MGKGGSSRTWPYPSGGWCQCEIHMEEKKATRRRKKKRANLFPGGGGGNANNLFRGLIT